MSAFALQAFGTGLSVLSAIQEGKAKQREAEFNRQQLEQDAKQREIEGMQTANARIKDFDAASANNLAFFAFLNRDASDRSVKAFMDAQRATAYEDAAIMKNQSQLEASQQRLRGDVEASRGQAASQASFVRATSSIVSGLGRYETYKV